MSKRFLVTYSAVIGRTTGEGAQHPPVYLTFYSMVEAGNSEEVQNHITQYSDPGFRTKVENITEVGDGLTQDELFDLLKHENVIKDTP